MSSKCSRCVYGEAYYSEEAGYDYICSLPDGNDINNCMLGTKDFFKGCDEETRMFMVPFCEKCGHIIKEKIGIDRTVKLFPSGSALDYRNYYDYIYPRVCPNCKAHFTAITTPTEESLYNGGYDAKKYLPGGTHFI